MDRSVRYEVLQGEEAQVPAEPMNLALVLPPPSYQEATVNGEQTLTCSAESSCPAYDTNLPSYKIATELPTYDEAERTKGEESRREESERNGDIERQDPESDHLTGMTIGTDGLFFCTFVIAFLFNWIGFLISLCISNTVAGRCGALSGLGLSIVKWAAIVKHNNWMYHYVAQGDTWVCWVLILCGFMIFFRGCVQYIRVKYEWQKLTGQLRRYYLVN